MSGGAGAVGHSAIELARWAGATVITTVSSAEKARLAARAGAHAIVNYRQQEAVDAIRQVAPRGVDSIVEVAPSANADLDAAVLAHGGTVAAYASAPQQVLSLPVRELMELNSRWQFVLVYTMPATAKIDAVAAVSQALRDGVLRVGVGAGLPVLHYGLEEVEAAHESVRSGAVGKVIVTVDDTV